MAGRTGQELNMTSLAVDVGVDTKTIQSWLGILESSFNNQYGITVAGGRKLMIRTYDHHSVRQRQGWFFCRLVMIKLRSFQQNAYTIPALAHSFEPDTLVCLFWIY